MNNKKRINPNYLGKNPKKKKRMKPMRCPYCGAPAKMVPEAEMNFRFHETNPAKRKDFFWVCSRYPECDVYIAADNHTKRPMGTMANPELRHMRMMIHYWQVLLVDNRVYTKGTFASMLASMVNQIDPRRFPGCRRPAACPNIPPVPSGHSQRMYPWRTFSAPGRRYPCG